MSQRMVSFAYRYRWLLAGGLVALVMALFGNGMKRITAFSAQVDALKDEVPEEAPPPRMFDARYDIWFDPADTGLRTYKDIEDRFVAEDAFILAFEDADDPWGVFGKKSLESIATRSVAATESAPISRWHSSCE